METDTRYVYVLSVEDIQYVAEQEGLDELSSAEIDGVERLLEKYVNWYDAIVEAIHDLKQNELMDKRPTASPAK